MKAKDKKSFIIIISLSVLSLILLSEVKIYTSLNNKDPELPIVTTTVENIEPLQAETGQEYTFIGDDGVEYIVNDKGMFTKREDGVLVQITNFVNIPIYQTFTLEYPNKSTGNFNLQEDGTCKIQYKFNDNITQDINCIYSAKNGLDEALKATNSADIKELAKVLNIDSVTKLNVNNLYRTSIYINPDENKQVDPNEEILENYDDNEILSKEDNIIEDFLIYFYTEPKLDFYNDESGYFINAIIYSIPEKTLYTQYGKNTKVKIDAFLPVNETKEDSNGK